MKVHKLKDTVAIFWFFVIALLQYNKYYTTVMALLFMGMLGDFIIATSDIGDEDINILIAKVL